MFKEVLYLLRQNAICLGPSTPTPTTYLFSYSNYIIIFYVTSALGNPSTRRNHSGLVAVFSGACTSYDTSWFVFLCDLHQVCIQRIMERGKTSGRTDDNMDSLKKRYWNTSVRWSIDCLLLVSQSMLSTIMFSENIIYYMLTEFGASSKGKKYFFPNGKQTCSMSRREFCNNFVMKLIKFGATLQ